MSLKLIISDLDGTILETEDYHRRAYNELFKEIGLSVTWNRQDYMDRLKIMGGGKLKEVFSWLNRSEKEYSLFKQEMYQRKTRLYIDLITADLSLGNLTLRPGIERLFNEIHQENIPLAIGTACEKKAAFEVLESALGSSFLTSLKTLGGGDDTPHKKPDPAIYLLVAEQCGVDPKDCVVLEDTNHGMKAALNAGMKCVVAPSEYAMEHDFTGASLCLKDFETPHFLTLKKVSALFA